MCVQANIPTYDYSALLYLNNFGEDFTGVRSPFIPVRYMFRPLHWRIEGPSPWVWHAVMMRCPPPPPSAPQEESSSLSTMTLTAW